MKIRCDVCEREEAALFCPSDEAALCDGCDRTIHHANKLATKHSRISLHHPNPNASPLCDICHEKRAYVFCQEDRAIVCRECDLHIHRANEHTQKHNRFLLTGMKLSPSVLGSDSEVRSHDHINRDRSSVCSQNPTSSSSFSSIVNNNYLASDQYMVSDNNSVSTSSISEYLIETIPGFCFEDLLDASFPPHKGFYKVCHSTRPNQLVEPETSQNSDLE